MMLGQLSTSWRRGIGAMAVSAFALVGCKEAELVDKSVVRSIKWEQLAPSNAAQERHIAGLLRPVDVSRVSFEVSGRVVAVHADLGDTVQAGDLLAIIDGKRFDLAVREAEARAAEAHALMRESQQDYERQRTLYDKGWVAKSAYDVAVAGFDAAKSQLQAAEARLGLTQRDQRLTELRAPFDGIISARDIEPFEEVVVGQPVFQMHTEGKLEIHAGVPATLVDKFDHGAVVSVSFPTAPDRSVSGIIAEIGTVAEAGSTFPVTVVLLDTPPALRAGMPAQLGLTFDTDLADEGFVVPISAIRPGPGDQNYAFVFDADSQSLRQVVVNPVELRDNTVLISGPLEAGDIVASAGVEFLADGLEVHLFEQPES